VLTKTTEMAIQVLCILALQGEDADPISPRLLARRLDASPSYMAKVTGLLVRAGILQATRGIHGGVQLMHRPERVTLLDVTEACQGKLLGDYCQDVVVISQTCAFHRAMDDLHQALVGALQRWTIGDLAAQPEPAPALRGVARCKMDKVAASLRKSWERETTARATDKADRKDE